MHMHLIIKAIGTYKNDSKLELQYSCTCDLSGLWLSDMIGEIFVLE